MDETAGQIETKPNTVAVELQAREFDWEIAPGHLVAGYGFNGQVPGPTIEADIGDTVVVRLTNRLPEATTIHWHGLRVPAEMDRTDMMQRPIRHGESFEYRFRVPDAATFWYHPHAHEPEQIERGLYGPFIVRGPDEPRLDRERVLVLDDLKLDRRGDIARFGGWIERHHGRHGNVRLVNGRREPELDAMAARQIERWRFINASNARYIHLSLGGRSFQVLGTTGGLLPSPIVASHVLLTPAARVDLAVGPFEEGETIEIVSLRGERRSADRFATVPVGPPAPSQAILPETYREIPPLVTGPVAPTRTVRLSGRFSVRRGVDFLVNDEQHHYDAPVRVGSSRCGTSSMSRGSTTPSTCTASSSRCSRRTASRSPCRGRTR